MLSKKIITTAAKNEKGFTLLEVLVAFIVLTIGLLGTVALQSSAKKASYDANQRSAALTLANDIVERIRSNDSANIVAQYDIDFNYSSTLPNVDCLNAHCNSATLAQFDTLQWQRALRMADNTGTLANGWVCINPTIAAGDPSGVNLKVIVAWTGRQKVTQNTTQSNFVCGDGDNRRMVMLDSYVFVRT